MSQSHAALLEDFLSKAGITVNGKQPWDMQVNHDGLFERIYKSPSLGAGESYTEGWWDCARLDEFFFRLFRYATVEQLYKKSTMAWFLLKHMLWNQQTMLRSRTVAQQHYDLNNDLYSAMLGKSMAYTCGYWKGAQDLTEAQYAKYDLICRKMRLQPNEQVLDLGCGWGGFAKFAAEHYDVVVTAVNISQEQMRVAKSLAAGLPITCYTADYRQPEIYNPKNIQFDKIISIGMCEHVGHRNYWKWFKLVRSMLKESGLFCLHTIGKNKSSHFADPWIRKYIFPNGMLPSMSQLAKTIEGIFIAEDIHNFGADYDKTLIAWHNNFKQHWEKFTSVYGENFYRLWSYYLLSCAGAFRARNLQLWQWILSPRGQHDGYDSVR